MKRNVIRFYWHYIVNLITATREQVTESVMASEDHKLQQLERKLDTLIRLVASTVGVGLSIGERAPLLQRAGLDRNSIAAVCNTTPAAVSVRLTEAKRKKPARKRAK